MKTQMLSFKNHIILLACMFALFSCESVKDKLTVNVDVGSFSIQLDDIEVVGDEAKSAIVRFADVFSSIKNDQVLSLAKLDLSTDLEEYKSRLESVVIGSASIIVEATDGEGKVVKNFLMKSSSITQELSVPEYQMCTLYEEDNLKKFVTPLLKKLFTGNEVTLNIDGTTNVAKGTLLSATIQLDKVVIKVKAVE